MTDQKGNKLVIPQKVCRQTNVPAFVQSKSGIQFQWQPANLIVHSPSVLLQGGMTLYPQPWRVVRC